MKKKIPLLLVYFRLLIGLFIPLIAILEGPDYKNLIVFFVLLGFVADIFDGIIARKLNVSDQHLRLLDSVIDRIFWLLILFSCYWLYPGYIELKLPYLVIVLSMDAGIYLLSFVRFQKIPSPHNILTKIWGIFIAISLTELLISGSSFTFDTMLVIGLVSRFDSLLIYLILKKWDHDIPSFYQAIQLNRGEKIKRHKLFNG